MSAWSSRGVVAVGVGAIAALLSQACGDSVTGDGKTVVETVEVCPADLAQCGQTCTRLDLDPQHCGTCGNACGTDQLCVDGTCASSCPAPLVRCGNECIDPDSSAQYCGATGSCNGDEAGEACAAGTVCNGLGECAVACAAGLVNCNGTCINPLTDGAYCGASGTCAGNDAGEACGAGEICDGMGSCAVSCQPGFLVCNGVCTDPAISKDHCGATGSCQGDDAGVACGPGEVCDGQGTCAPDCQVGLLNCDGTCTDPLTDEAHCGAVSACTGPDAGVVCGQGELCVLGQCELSCPPGYTRCGNQCIDPLSDAYYCGAGPDCQVDPGESCATPFSPDAGDSGVCIGGLCYPGGITIFIASTDQVTLADNLVDGGFDGTGANGYCWEFDIPPSNAYDTLAIVEEVNLHWFLPTFQGAMGLVSPTGQYYPLVTTPAASNLNSCQPSTNYTAGFSGTLLPTLAHDSVFGPGQIGTLGQPAECTTENPNCRYNMETMAINAPAVGTWQICSYDACADGVLRKPDLINAIIRLVKNGP